MKAIGIPMSMFTVIFAISRTIGWIAHWNEMHSDRIRRSAARVSSIPVSRSASSPCSTSVESRVSDFFCYKAVIDRLFLPL